MQMMYSLCADTVGNLQKLLNVLNQYCEEWGMNVNLRKSKIMVLRNGGMFVR